LRRRARRQPSSSWPTSSRDSPPIGRAGSWLALGCSPMVAPTLCLDSLLVASNLASVLLASDLCCAGFRPLLLGPKPATLQTLLRCCWLQTFVSTQKQQRFEARSFGVACFKPLFRLALVCFPSCMCTPVPCVQMARGHVAEGSGLRDLGSECMYVRYGMGYGRSLLLTYPRFMHDAVDRLLSYGARVPKHWLQPVSSRAHPARHSHPCLLSSLFRRTAANVV
jgi:hypothetical protein